MGKVPKGSKGKPRRHNPVRVPDSHLGHGVRLAEQTSSKGGQVIPVLDKLDSPEVEDRRWACAAVSSLIQNDASTRRLLQAKGVVDKLITRLSDTDDDVIAEAVGSLRNLAVDGGYDMCAHIFNRNVLAPLKAFIPKITATLQEFLGTSPPKNPKGLKRRVYELAENVITLFWCLSETSNKALSAINDANLTPFLMAFLMSKDKIPLKTVLAAAQCLYVLSDDNDPTAQIIRRTHTYTSCLLGLVTSPESESPADGMVIDKPNDSEQRTTLRVLACGILKNISPLPTMGPTPPEDLEKKVTLPLLTSLLDYSLQNAANKVQDLVTAESLKESTKPLKGCVNDSLPKPDHKTETELELELIEGQLRTLILALEVLTGVCANLPDPEPVKEDEEVVEEIEMDDEDDDEVIEEQPQPTSATTSSQTNSLNLIATLTRPLLALARPTPLSFSQSSVPTVHPPTTSALGTIHVRALECLNNLFLGINTENVQLPEGAAKQATEVWNDVWSVLAAVGKQSEWTVGSAVEVRKEMWEVGVGVLWGLARIGKGELIPDSEQVSALIEFCDWTNDEMIKVKCVGTLGCLAQRGDAIEANRVIGSYLFSYLTTPLPNAVILWPEATLHAASSIIDIYADEDQPYDINFRQAGWTETLASAKDRVKRAGRAIDRKKEGGRELKEFADEVFANVKGFVQYRRRLKI